MKKSTISKSANRAAAHETAPKSTGQVLLMSYTDSKFVSLCREYRGFYILDAREKGWAKNEALRTERLAEAFGERYKLMPALAVSRDETPESYLRKIAPAIERILQVTEKGRSVIITTFSSRLLKCLGHVLMSQNAKIPVWLRWENKDGEGISRQKPMVPEDFIEKLTAECGRRADGGFKVNDDIDVSDDFDDFSDF